MGDMRTATNTGTDWCPPTKELKNSQLIKLVGETRQRPETHSPEIEIVHERPKRESIVPLLTRKRVDSGSAKPLEDAWFCDSNQVPAELADASQPLVVESESRFKVEALPPPPKNSKPVYPIHH